jgi:hypothetical protein
MKIVFTKYFILISLIKFAISETNKIINIKNITTDQDKQIPENITFSNISKTPIDIPIININTINKTSEAPKSANVTFYDNKNILDILVNSPKKSDNKNNSETQTIINDDDIDKMEDEVQNIIIQNTHEDQLAESLFYFLCFVLIIFIILFLYKFYKCYCQNTIKDFGEEGTIRNPNNDPELQRISTHDDENIMDVNEAAADENNEN